MSASVYFNGGKQTPYQASLIWIPTDYVRLIAEYSHVSVIGGPRPTLSLAADPIQAQLGMFPFGSTSEPINQREFDSDVFTARAQIDL